MIEQTEAMQILVEACPSFEYQWKQHIEAYGNDVLYAAAGAFAAHLLERFQTGDTEAFSAVGTAIENCTPKERPGFESSPPSVCLKAFRMFGAIRRRAQKHSFRSSAQSRSAGGVGSTISGQRRLPM